MKFNYNLRYIVSILTGIMLATSSIVPVDSTFIYNAGEPDMHVMEKKPDENGWTLFMHAANSGNVNMIRYLLDVGENINTKDKKGRNALHVIASWGVIDSLDTDCKSALKSTQSRFAKSTILLLKRGIEIDAKDNDGNTALDIAKKHHPELAKIITKFKNGETLGHRSCKLL